MNITKAITYEQARKLLGVCRKKFKAMREKEGFPQIDVGNKNTKIILRDVEEYLAFHKHRKCSTVTLQQTEDYLTKFSKEYRDLQSK